MSTWPWELTETHDGLEILRHNGEVYAEYALNVADNPDKVADDALIDFTRLYVALSEAASDTETAAAPVGANAPYKIKRIGDAWAVVNNAGLIKAKFGQDRNKAVAYLRALYANVKGAPARAAKVKFSGKARNRVPETAADASKPYGNVTYADPGYQKDGKKRYPLDTKEHAKAAWSYINQGDNADPYSSTQLAAIKGRIKAACKRFGIQISD